MDFKLSEEQELIINMAKEFAEREVAPSKEVDKNHRFPKKPSSVARVGLMGIPISEEYEGRFRSYLYYGCGELSRLVPLPGNSFSAYVCVYLSYIPIGNKLSKNKICYPSGQR